MHLEQVLLMQLQLIPKKQKYWLATLENNDVVRLLPLSQSGAIFAVQSGRNIICRDNKSAERVAKRIKGASEEWECHDFGDEEFGDSGYYPHYHGNAKKHGDPHIWFYPFGQVPN